VVRSLGLNHINLTVSDIVRAEKFYLEAFGLEVRFREGAEMVFVGAAGGHDLVTLCQAKQGEAVGAAGGIGHFGFRVARDDFDAMVAQVERAGGVLLRRGAHTTSEPFAYFSDPDGYTIELGL
jgi:catechol 2,3-dioxygenase-like lactoylglutathione lyase family enzyme